MSDRPDEIAAGALEQALRVSGASAAACESLMRLAGQALARLTSHDRACQVHARLARRHAERAARCWRP